MVLPVLGHISPFQVLAVSCASMPPRIHWASRSHSSDEVAVCTSSESSEMLIEAEMEWFLRLECLGPKKKKKSTYSAVMAECLRSRGLCQDSC